MNENTNARSGDQTERKYVFVCGLGRSGTSVLGRNIARLENCTGFKNTGVLEDEGQFLQDVYPTDRLYGGAGSYGFDPRAHLTETSDLVSAANALKLRLSWERYWDASKSICVEKTPANLLRTRFLQAMFPNSYFVLIRRHPIAVSMANNHKWKMSFTALHNLLDHWLHCHEIFDTDKKYLKHIYELKYEDYIQNPDKCHREIAAFIGTQVPESTGQDGFRFVVQSRNPVGLRVPESAMEDVTGAHNQKYFKCWSHLLNNSRFKWYHRYIAVKYEPIVSKYDYSLIKGFGVAEGEVKKAMQFSATTAAFYCLLANAYGLLIRMRAQGKAKIMTQLRRRLPDPVKTAIKRFLSSPLFSGNQPHSISS
jgi:sulfotransferase family protein